MDCDRLRSAGKEKSARRGDWGRECLAEVADIDRSMDARRSSERPRSIEARKGWSPSDRKDGGGIETSSGCHPVAGIRVASGARMLAAAGWYGSDMLCVHTVRASRSTGCHRLCEKESQTTGTRLAAAAGWARRSAVPSHRRAEARAGQGGRGAVHPHPG